MLGQLKDVEQQLYVKLAKEQGELIEILEECGVSIDFTKSL